MSSRLPSQTMHQLPTANVAVLVDIARSIREKGFPITYESLAFLEIPNNEFVALSQACSAEPDIESRKKHIENLLVRILLVSDFRLLPHLKPIFPGFQALSTSRPTFSGDAGRETDNKRTKLTISQSFDPSLFCIPQLFVQQPQQPQQPQLQQYGDNSQHANPETSHQVADLSHSVSLAPSSLPMLESCTFPTSNAGSDMSADEENNDPNGGSQKLPPKSPPIILQVLRTVECGVSWQKSLDDFKQYAAFELSSPISLQTQLSTLLPSEEDDVDERGEELPMENQHRGSSGTTNVDQSEHNLNLVMNRGSPESPPSKYTRPKNSLFRLLVTDGINIYTAYERRQLIGLVPCIGGGAALPPSLTQAHPCLSSPLHPNHFPFHLKAAKGSWGTKIAISSLYISYNHIDLYPSTCFVMSSSSAPCTTMTQGVVSTMNTLTYQWNSSVNSALTDIDTDAMSDNSDRLPFIAPTSTATSVSAPRSLANSTNSTATNENNMLQSINVSYRNLSTYNATPNQSFIGMSSFQSHLGKGKDQQSTATTTATATPPSLGFTNHHSKHTTVPVVSHFNTSASFQEICLSKATSHEKEQRNTSAASNGFTQDQDQDQADDMLLEKSFPLDTIQSKTNKNKTSNSDMFDSNSSFREQLFRTGVDVEAVYYGTPREKIAPLHTQGVGTSMTPISFQASLPNPEISSHLYQDQDQDQDQDTSMCEYSDIPTLEPASLPTTPAKPRISGFTPTSASTSASTSTSTSNEENVENVESTDNIMSNKPVKRSNSSGSGPSYGSGNVIHVVELSSDSEDEILLRTPTEISCETKPTSSLEIVPKMGILWEKDQDMNMNLLKSNPNPHQQISHQQHIPHPMVRRIFQEILTARDNQATPISISSLSHFLEFISRGMVPATMLSQLWADESGCKTQSINSFQFPSLRIFARLRFTTNLLNRRSSPWVTVFRVRDGASMVNNPSYVIQRDDVVTPQLTFPDATNLRLRGLLVAISPQIIDQVFGPHLEGPLKNEQKLASASTAFSQFIRTFDGVVKLNIPLWSELKPCYGGLALTQLYRHDHHYCNHRRAKDVANNIPCSLPSHIISTTHNQLHQAFLEGKIPEIISFPDSQLL